MEQLQLSDLVNACKRWMRFYTRSWKLNSLVIFVALFTGLVFALLQDKQYQAKVSFIIEERSSKMPSGLSGLASSFGVNLGGLSGGESLLAGDNFFEIIRSRTLMEKVLYSKYYDRNRLDSLPLVNRYLISSGLKEKWNSKVKGFDTLVFSSDSIDGIHTSLKDSLMGEICQRIIEKNLQSDHQNKGGSVLFVTVTTEDPLFSALFSERLVEEARDWFINLKTEIALTNLQQFQHRADSLQRLIALQTYNTATEQILNPNEAFKTALVPVEISQRERLIQQTLYAEVVKNLEFSRMALSSQTPVVHILDRPHLPLKGQQRSITMILSIAVALGLLFSLFLAFLRFPTQH